MFGSPPVNGISCKSQNGVSKLPESQPPTYSALKAPHNWCHVKTIIKETNLHYISKSFLSTLVELGVVLESRVKDYEKFCDSRQEKRLTSLELQEGEKREAKLIGDLKELFLSLFPKELATESVKPSLCDDLITVPAFITRPKSPLGGTSELKPNSPS